MRVLMAAAVLMLGAGQAPAGGQEPQTETIDMPFEQCLETIRRAAGELGVAPINLVETDILRIVRFCVDGGSVLVTCSRPDAVLAMTVSPETC